jgi:hypothetical protein
MTLRFAAPALAAILLAAAPLSGCMKPSIEQRFDASLAAQTPEGEAMRAFKKDFPQDFAAMRSEVIAAGAQNMTDQQIADRAANQVRAFVARNAAATAAGSTATLARLAKTDADFIAALQRQDVMLCAKFGLRGLDNGDVLKDEANQIGAKVFLTQLEATREGREHPTPHTDIGAADGARLADQLKADGVDDRLLNIIAGSMTTAAPPDACAGSVAMYRAIATMPPEDAARWTAFVLKQSAQSMR